MAAPFEKIVIVTRKTRLEELVERFNTVAQARFYIEHAGGAFGPYQEEHDAYHRSLHALERSLDLGLRVQVVDRRIVPTFIFTERDLVVTAGQDGLVANTAKYVGGQPIIAVNPDPARFDGVLLPFAPGEARAAAEMVLRDRATVRQVTLAEAVLGDGQRLLAFNDLFVGARSHVSARYRLSWNGQREDQSSSGVLVSTGAGSTGWLSSLFQMAVGLTRFQAATQKRPSPPEELQPFTLPWEDRRLVFVVREPFASRHSQASIVAGLVFKNGGLELESSMPSGGVIFSDGIEEDFLNFNSGAVARIGPAEQRARLVVPRPR